MTRGKARITCTARAKSTGVRCAKPPIRGGRVCLVHGGRAPQVRAKAAERLVRAQQVKGIATLDAWLQRHRAIWALAEQLPGVGSPAARRWSDPRDLRAAAAMLRTVARELCEQAREIEQRMREEKAAMQS